MTTPPVSQPQIARLLMQYRTALYGYIYACVRDHVDTEDILQNVSVAVTESFDQLAREEEFLPWAREIARRRVLAFCRKAKRERPVDPAVVQSLAEAEARVEQENPANSQHSALLACLEKLAPARRELILLRYDRGTSSVEEIAQRLGRTVQSVYAAVKRIKATLRACVQRTLAAEKNA